MDIQMDVEDDACVLIVMMLSSLFLVEFLHHLFVNKANNWKMFTVYSTRP
jgi:hypothetical protein